MLDVHPPHHSPHGWRDFIIHIATIVVGLLIAIGLEQTVEFFHHREQASHAREALAQEIEYNRNVARRDLYTLRMHEDYLFADLQVIARARAHQLHPTDRIVTWHPAFVFVEASWKTARESTATAYFATNELRRYDAAYSLQDFFNTGLITAQNTMLRTATVFYDSAADRFNYQKVGPDDNMIAAGSSTGAAAHAAFENQAPGPDKVARLTPAQLDRLQQAIQQGIFDDEQLIGVCQGLPSVYDDIASGHDTRGLF